MDRLSSCYFCGIALDEPLRDYPLVADGEGEPSAVVTLCPTCRRKLETILGVVSTDAENEQPTLRSGRTAALEGAPEQALTEPADAETGPDTAGEPVATGTGEEHDVTAGEVTVAATAAGEDADDATPLDTGVGAGPAGDDAESVAADAGDGEDAAETDKDTEPEPGPESEPPESRETDDADDDRPQRAVQPDDPGGVDGSPAANDETDGDTDTTGTGAAGTADATETDAPAEPLAQAGGETDDPGTGTGTVTADAEDGAEGGDGDDPDGNSEAGDADAAGTTVSALEYNKVMRLLQNREFPVDRGEIVTVATSAYDLSRSDVMAVVDLAVERDLLAREGSQLVRPE